MIPNWTCLLLAWIDVFLCSEHQSGGTEHKMPNGILKRASDNLIDRTDVLLTCGLASVFMNALDDNGFKG